MIVCAVYVQSLIPLEDEEDRSRRIFFLQSKEHKVSRYDNTEQIARHLISDLMDSAERVQTKGSGYSFEKVRVK